MADEAVPDDIMQDARDALAPWMHSVGHEERVARALMAERAKLEAEIATLRAGNERLREALAAIDRYDIFADVSLVNQIFRLKNSAHAALKGGE